MEENNNKNNVKVEWDLSQIYSNIDELKKDIEKELNIIETLALAIGFCESFLLVLHNIFRLFKGRRVAIQK